MTKSKHVGRGGKRPGAGRKRKQDLVLAFNETDARIIRLLTRHYRSMLHQPRLTEKQAVMQEMSKAWDELDRHYQEAAEIAQEPYIL